MTAGAQTRDHGGGLDDAVKRFGGHRTKWLDLSTGINPTPYPIGDINADAWTALPDRAAFETLERAARRFWSVPEDAAILPAPGASALIARIPVLRGVGKAVISGPTYNEHAAAFQAHGWHVIDQGAAAARVIVHPNNPDGRLWPAPDDAYPLTVIDESFCDVAPDASHIALANRPGVLVLKSFGKFWGLAGLRLGFAIGDPELIAHLRDTIGPWQVSGPGLEVGARALADQRWAEDTRARLAQDASRLDALVCDQGAELVGGTTLFRLYDVQDAALWQTKLAHGKVWSRIFPYSSRWLRLGLPPADRWAQLEAAL
ncbi:threonine-phosphate decarboxylase [Aliiroseovarius sp. 2305UL8-7]|uniref:threonine-phosphate decarboxylase n=1 Tax=Aliiroseovarius conchicola TaxID=3121637 RepID=UPI003529BF92